MTKIKCCSKCGKTLSSTSKSTGNWCRKCHASYDKTRRNSSPERIAKHRLAALKSAAKQKGYEPPDITHVELAKILGSGRGECELCGKSCAFCLDHDHKTGKVRGLLCRLCNNLLGHSGDSPSLLRSAAIYLESHQ